MIKIVIKYKGAVPRAMRKRFRVVSAFAHKVAGTWWHATMRPKHFTQAGRQEYRYSRRTKDYRFRKMREKGHNNPLVFSGISRLTTRLRDVRATSKGVRVVMRAGNLAKQNPKSRVNMQDELTRVSRREEREIVRRYQTEITKGLNRIRFEQRVDLNR